jgi:hypothetical protein
MFMLCSGISGNLQSFSGLKLPKFIEHVKGMFYGCTGITYIPYNFLQDARLLTDLSDLFNECTELKEIGTDFIVPPNVKTLNRTFKNCISLKTNLMSFIKLNVFTSAVEMFSRM